MHLDASATRCQRESLHLDARCSSVQPSVHLNAASEPLQRRVKVSEATRPTQKLSKTLPKFKYVCLCNCTNIPSPSCVFLGRIGTVCSFRDVPAMC